MNLPSITLGTRKVQGWIFLVPVLILLSCAPDNEYIDPRSRSSHFLSSDPSLAMSCLLFTLQSHSTMWHCLYSGSSQFPSSFFVEFANDTKYSWDEAKPTYSRLLNDLCYSPIHVLSVMFVMSNFHTMESWVLTERDAATPHPPEPGQGASSDGNAGFAGNTLHQWRSRDHRMRDDCYKIAN